MYQIYFLSIIINLIVGIILARNIVAGRFPSVGKFLEEIGTAKAFRLGGGIAAVAVGILKLLLVPADDVLIVGDIFPALASMFAGTALLSKYFQEKTPSPLSPRMSRVADFFVSNKQIFGIAAITAAVLHFFFNQALFL